MKRLFILLLMLPALISSAQDTINYSQLNFKCIKNKEVLVYANWGYKRPCSLPSVIPSMFPDLDTNVIAGELVTDKEWETLHLDKTKFDTIVKCGKVEIGTHTAYLVRNQYGTMPQIMYLYIYNKEGAEVYSLEIASFNYGESGSACLMSVLQFDKKNEKIVVTSFAESEGWFLREDEIGEDGTVKEGDYCTYSGSELDVTSIDMRTLKVAGKKYNSEEKSCE